jgi:glycosyltransferase involved in cell wall biosynthesis
VTASLENNNGLASPYRYTFTVFTPTYNRAHTLHRVNESLQKQTFRDFEWLILDDGSIDGTSELVNSWQNKPDFPIRYTWQENQGINAAINKGVKEAQGEFFLIIGSDDSFVPETLARFHFYWNAIPKNQQERFVGVTACCKDQNGNLIGGGLQAEIIDSDSIEIRYKYKIKGEMWGFLRTEILKLFPFPVIPGSKFVPEGLIWNAIAKKYKTRFVNVPLRVYWTDENNNSDQLTKTRNPGLYAKGLVLWYQSKLTTEINWIFNDPREFFRSAVHYGRFSFHAGVGIREQFRLLKNIWAKGLWLIMLPVAVWVFLWDRK